MSSFTGSFGDAGDTSRVAGVTRPFDLDGYSSSDDVFPPQPVPENPLPASIYFAGDGLSPELNGIAVASDGPLLPPHVEMQSEEGFALREWRRQNAIRLEEKEKKEKELVREIIEDADKYKTEFHRKWKVRCENNRTSNREKEELYLESREKFHAEASNNYFKAIAELIPNEVPTIEKKGKKKDQEKKPSVIVIQGPKPGKPTDLSRMRQVLVKLKHNPPSHMKPPPKPSSEPGKDAKTGPSLPADAIASAKPVAEASSEAVVAA